MAPGGNMNLIFELGRAQRLREDIEKMIIVEKEKLQPIKAWKERKRTGMYVQLMDNGKTM